MYTYVHTSESNLRNHSLVSNLESDFGSDLRSDFGTDLGLIRFEFCPVMY